MAATVCRLPGCMLLTLAVHHVNHHSTHWHCQWWATGGPRGLLHCHWRPPLPRDIAQASRFVFEQFLNYTLRCTSRTYAPATPRVGARGVFAHANTHTLSVTLWLGCCQCTYMYYCARPGCMHASTFGVGLAADHTRRGFIAGCFRGTRTTDATKGHLPGGTLVRHLPDGAPARCFLMLLLRCCVAAAARERYCGAYM